MSKLSNRTVVIIGFSIMILGFILITQDYFHGKKDKAYEKISVSLYQESQDGTIIDNTPKEVASADIAVSDNIKKGNYIGVLRIDKINLEQGFYDKNNENNNYNIEMNMKDFNSLTSDDKAKYYKLNYENKNNHNLFNVFIICVKIKMQILLEYGG